MLYKLRCICEHKNREGEMIDLQNYLLEMRLVGKRLMSSMMNMYRRMTTQLLKKKPSRLLFMKLFRYISGLNEGEQ
jgi:hypothetical protein